MLHRAHVSCDYQLELYILHRSTIRLTTLLAFVNVLVMSFDRHSALSKPLQYRANMTNIDAIKRAVFAGVSATIFIVATEFILSSNIFLLFVFSVAVGSFIVVTPIINHVRMFIAVRRQRNQVADAVASNQQRAMILRREKKVAYDMLILIAALAISVVPSSFLKAFKSSFIQEYRYFFPWSVTFALMKASANPIINFWRNKELKNAMKSLMRC
ncbi:hypothetical protein ACROYT_G022009 [Oculina patagonica]